MVPLLAGEMLPYCLKILRRIAYMLQHGLQVFKVEQQQAAVIGYFEDQCHHARLGVVQIQNPADEQRTHLRDGGAHRMALFAEHVPEGDRASGKIEAG
jgi:hypothetical protein